MTTTSHVAVLPSGMFEEPHVIEVPGVASTICAIPPLAVSVRYGVLEIEEKVLPLTVTVAVMPEVSETASIPTCMLENALLLTVWLSS